MTARPSAFFVFTLMILSCYHSDLAPNISANSHSSETDDFFKFYESYDIQNDDKSEKSESHAVEDNWFLNGVTPILKAQLWIAKHQSTDGAWRADLHSVNTNNASTFIDECDISLTALCVLALCADHLEGIDIRCWESAKRGIFWLASQQYPNGKFATERGDASIATQSICILSISKMARVFCKNKYANLINNGLSFLFNELNLQHEASVDEVFWVSIATESAKSTGVNIESEYIAKICALFNVCASESSRPNSKLAFVEAFLFDNFIVSKMQWMLSEHEMKSFYSDPVSILAALYVASRYDEQLFCAVIHVDEIIYDAQHDDGYWELSHNGFILCKLGATAVNCIILTAK